MRSPMIDQAQTSATGANWVAFSDAPSSCAWVVNSSGTTIEYRINAGGNTIQVASGDRSAPILGLENLKNLSVRRVDQSNSQVNVQAQTVADL